MMMITTVKRSDARRTQYHHGQIFKGLHRSLELSFNKGTPLHPEIRQHRGVRQSPRARPIQRERRLYRKLHLSWAAIRTHRQTYSLSSNGSWNVQFLVMVNSGASQYFLDPTLLPQVSKLNVSAQRHDFPINLIGAGSAPMQGTSTGHLKALVMDSNGKRNRPLLK